MKTFARIPIGGQVLLVERRRDVRGVSMVRLRYITESKRGGCPGAVVWIYPSALSGLLQALLAIASGEAGEGFAARVPAEGRELIVELPENPAGQRLCRISYGPKDVQPLWVPCDHLVALVAGVQSVAESFGGRAEKAANKGGQELDTAKG